VISSRVAYAFSAGLVAAINPCGFALLPTYLAYFLGIDSANDSTSNDPSASGDKPSSTSRDLGRAIAVGATMTAGFLTVFTIMGLAWSSMAGTIKENIPWAGLFIGILLIGAGIAMLRGYEPTIRLPKLDMGGSTREFGSIYVYGVSYAIASLSCTLPIFAATLTATIDTEGYVQSATVVIAYGLGMGVLVTALTVATALARAGLVNRLRSAMGMIGKISGAFLIVAGAFVTWYAYTELRIIKGDTDNPAFDQVSATMGGVQNWLTNHKSLVAWICAGFLAAVAGAVVWGRARRDRADAGAGANPQEL
jgi:cytochrome c-type biogenesis protein